MFQVTPLRCLLPTVHATSVFSGTRVRLRRFSNDRCRIFCKRGVNCCESIGFCRKYVAPSENDKYIVSFSSRPVTIIMGVLLLQADSRIILASSKPDKVGMLRSRKIP